VVDKRASVEMMQEKRGDFHRMKALEMMMTMMTMMVMKVSRMSWRRRRRTKIDFE